MHTNIFQQLPNMMPSPSPSLTLPDFGNLPFSSELSPSPTQSQFGLPPPAKKFKGRTSKNKDPIIIKNMQDSWVVPGVSAGGQQVPNFSQFSPYNLQSSVLQQQSPSPFAPSSLLGMGNENVSFSGTELGQGGVGMGLPFGGGEDPTVCMDSPANSDVDVRLRSLSSLGTSVNGSIQDLTLSASHSSTVVANHCLPSAVGRPVAMTADAMQSLDDNSPPPPPFSGFVSGSNAIPVAPMLPLKTTPTTTAQGSLDSDSIAATSLIAKPPSLLDDHCDLLLTPSSTSSLSAHDLSLLATASVHRVETLPNSFNTGSSDLYHPAPSQHFPPPVPPAPPVNNGAPLPNGCPPQYGSSSSSSSSYQFLPHGSFGQHGQDISLPVSNPPLHFAASTYSRLLPEGSSHNTPLNGMTKHNAPLPSSSLPATHVDDSELARVDEYMQKYLSESRSQESLKNGTNTAILNATKEHDKLISQVLLMSPVRSGSSSSERRSSGATTAMYLSILEETETNSRGTPFAATAVASSSVTRGNIPHKQQRVTRKESTDDLAALEGLSSPLQRHSVAPAGAATTTTVVQQINSSSTSSTSSSDASPLPSSHTRMTFPDHHRETISDTSSGVSSASTKLSTTTCSSGQSSPVSSTSPTTLISPPASPPMLDDNFSYPSPDKSDGYNRERSVSQSSSPDVLLDQIYEPFPALSSDDGEYMVESPDLRPPPPPKVKGKIDLYPKVPIYEVSLE